MIPATLVRAVDEVGTEELLSLYSSVGWDAYAADPEGLAAAVANSTIFVEARSAGDLIGLARGMSNDVSIFYLQDIGRKLLGECLDRFAHVRQKVLLTDGSPGQHRFYEAMGYTDVATISRPTLHAFVRMEGLDLETAPQPADIPS